MPRFFSMRVREDLMEEREAGTEGGSQEGASVVVYAWGGDE